jgi:hypothetical protein
MKKSPAVKAFVWCPSDIECDETAFEALGDSERKFFELTLRLLDVLEPDIALRDRTRH